MAVDDRTPPADRASRLDTRTRSHGRHRPNGALARPRAAEPRAAHHTFAWLLYTSRAGKTDMATLTAIRGGAAPAPKPLSAYPKVAMMHANGNPCLVAATMARSSA